MIGANQHIHEFNATTHCCIFCGLHRDAMMYPPRYAPTGDRGTGECDSTRHTKEPHP